MEFSLSGLVLGIIYFMNSINYTDLNMVNESVKMELIWNKFIKNEINF